MEYRVKIEEYPNGSALYIPQAKKCLFWRNIRFNEHGEFIIRSGAYSVPIKCNTLDHAQSLISSLKNKQIVKINYIEID